MKFTTCRSKFSHAGCLSRLARLSSSNRVQDQQYIKIYHGSSQELEIRGCTLNLVAKHR